MSRCRSLSFLLTLPFLVLIFKSDSISRLAPLATWEKLLPSRVHQNLSPAVQEAVSSAVRYEMFRPIDWQIDASHFTNPYYDGPFLPC